MKPVKGFEGLYSIARDGRVYSHPNNLHDGLWLKPKLNADGYLLVNLSKRSHGVNRRVHRLLAIAYIPNPKKLPMVNHRNGVKTDIRLRNLHWCTAQQNSAHAYAKGLLRPRGRKMKVARSRKIR